MLKRFFAPLAIVLAFAAYLVPAAANAAKDGYNHHLIIHVDDDDKGKMDIAMNNAANVTQYYQSKGQKVMIEIVAYGPGLNMLIPAKSHVHDRITNFAGSFDNISFVACGNTKAKMEKKSGKPVVLYDFAKPAVSGVVQIMTRQDQGWHYLRP